MEEVNFAVNDHFEDFIFDWSYKDYFLVGGYGSSKSYHVATKILLKLQQEKRKCLVVREVYDTIRDSCYSLFEDNYEYETTKKSHLAYFIGNIRVSCSFTFCLQFPCDRYIR